MSEMETVKGKIKLVPLGGKTIDELCEYICKINGHGELADYCDSWLQQIQEELYNDYLIINNNLYRMIEKEELDPYGFSIASNNEDGTIDYFVSFYNGGACLSEVVEEAVKKL